MILALALAAAALPVHAAAAPDATTTIAVAPFASTYYPDYTVPAMVSAITDALVSSGKYNVVARAQLDKVLAEQSLNNSDLVDPKAAQKVGRLLGAKYVVLGSLISVNFQNGYPVSKDKYETKVQIQLVETETGSIKVSDTFVGTESGYAMQREPTNPNVISVSAGIKCFENNLKSIAQQFIDRLTAMNPLEGLVVAIEGDRVAINLGASSGVKVGQEFFVFTEGNALKDPATGEVLSRQKTNIARLVVVSVEPKLSWTTIVATYSPGTSIETAMSVALAEKERKKEKN
jgi:curli biogenesis system outer membrane secretion channel CsgG